VKLSQACKILELGLIAGLSLTSGCFMSSEKRQQREALRAALAGTGKCWSAPADNSSPSMGQVVPCPPGVPAGSVISVETKDLTVYSEVEGTSPPAAPLMAQSGEAFRSGSEEQGEQTLTVPRAGAQLPPTPGPTPAATRALPAPSPARTPVATVLQPQPPAAPPPAAPEEAANEKIILRGVMFGRYSTDLGPGDEQILDTAVDVLRRHPNVRIYVKGYSDSRGDPDRNQFLSQERAANVAAYLQSQGVPLRQLVVLGMGTSHPIASNDTAAGRAKNRRVELEPAPEEP
jgi:outer membrane protein OmpA-like peptidoglycan-associated protein